MKNHISNEELAALKTSLRVFKGNPFNKNKREEFKKLESEYKESNGNLPPAEKLRLLQKMRENIASNHHHEIYSCLAQEFISSFK